MQGVKAARVAMNSAVLVKLSATIAIHLARRVPLSHLLRIRFTFSIRRVLTNPLLSAMLLKMRLLLILQSETMVS
jgi:hypothetical protein